MVTTTMRDEIETEPVETEPVEAEREPDKAPPRRRAATKRRKTTRKAGADKQPTRRPPRISRERALRETLQTAGGLLAMADPVCGFATAEAAPKIAQALDRAAKDSPRLAAWLDGLTKVGPKADLFIAVGGLVVTVLAHHVPSFGEALGRVIVGEVKADDASNSVE